MSTDQNKEIAHEFFARLSASDTAGALDLIAEDATWTIIGKPDQLSSAGVYNKERLGRLFHFMYKQMPNGLQMTVKGTTAEGNKVAVEAESRGELANGRVYEQTYHVLMEFQDGKIHTVREYIDTQHAYAVWVAPQAVPSQS
jgi:ketosteroid isomerase-like protein